MPFDFSSARPASNTFDFASAQPIAAASPMTVDQASQATDRALVRGVPVVGGYLNKGVEAANAAFRAATGMAPGTSLSDRYNTDYSRQQADDAALDQQHPFISAGAKLTGGILGAAAIPLPGVAAAASLPVKMAVSGLTGALVNGADAAVNTPGSLSDRLEAAKVPAVIGAAIGGVAPAAIAGAGRMLGVKPSVPSMADLGTKRAALYAQADPLPMPLSAPVVKTLSDEKGQEAITHALNGAMWNAATDPAAARQAAELQGLLPQNGGVISPGATVSAGTADAIHQAFGELGDKMGGRAGKGAFARAEALDNDLNQIPGMADARAAYRTEQNGKMIEQARLDAQNAGGAAANYQAEFKKLVNGPRFKFFSAPEQDAIRQVAQGGGAIAKGLGSLASLGHSVASSAGAVLAAEGGHSIFAAPKIAGSIAGPVQSKLVSSSADAASQLARNGGAAVGPQQFTPETAAFLRRLAISLPTQFFSLPRPSGQ